ncbi:hypothetical protein ABIC09_005921 [Bradyrhizobium sp. S3.12.5]|uniref:hypothetical protein n=1 Tax=Bradyrhizobium sp. S3.12.5 TaxID=3156386 RepID=UPI00339B3D17
MRLSIAPAELVYERGAVIGQTGGYALHPLQRGQTAATEFLARVRKHALDHKGPVAKETVVAIWRDVHDRSPVNGA